MSLQGVEFLSGFGIPYLDSFISTRRDNTFAIWTEGA
jgi:hypothetical protein